MSLEYCFHHAHRYKQEYPAEPLLRLSAPRAEILLAGNLNRELQSWLGIYPTRFSCCDFCLKCRPWLKRIIIASSLAPYCFSLWLISLPAIFGWQRQEVYNYCVTRKACNCETIQAGIFSPPINIPLNLSASASHVDIAGSFFFLSTIFIHQRLIASVPTFLWNYPPYSMFYQKTTCDRTKFIISVQCTLLGPSWL